MKYFFIALVTQAFTTYLLLLTTLQLPMSPRCLYFLHCFFSASTHRPSFSIWRALILWTKSFY